MSRNASGTMSLLGPLATANAVPVTTTVNGIMNDIATEMTDSLSRSGKGGMQAALDMGNFKVSNAADGTLAQDVASLKQVQTSVVQKATAVAGTVDAIQLTFSPANTAWTSGERIRWISGGANTVVAPTISKDAGATSKTVKKGASAALVAGDFGASGCPMEAEYNGTDVILINPQSSASFTGGTLSSTTSMSGKAFNEAKGASVASASTTDIWTPADGNYIHITGTTTITSFGTAPQAGAERVLVFDSALTITYNATTLKTPTGASLSMAAGSFAIVRADTTTNMIVIYASSASSAAPVKHTTVLTSGTTWTTNAAHKWATVTVIGGGAGGGGSGSANQSAGGGGAGGVAIKTYLTLAPSTAYTISVGGAGGGGNGSSGGNGGNTTFTDGTTLITGSGGTGGGGSGSGGAGGAATNGDVNLPGSQGGTTSNGSGASGAGGSNLYGYGGQAVSGATINGQAGSGYGAGGSGNVGFGGVSGGAGKAGAIIIEEWY